MDASLRLAFNENPFGPPPAAVEVLAQLAAYAHVYPFGWRQRVEEKAAAKLGVSPTELLLVPGFESAADSLINQAGGALTLQPGFPVSAHRAEALGLPSYLVPLDGLGQPLVEPEALPQEGVLFVGSPGNPLGNCVDSRWLERALAHQKMVCFDETYLAFSGRSSFIGELPRWPNAVVYHSLSKSHGLGGLRISALVANRQLLAPLRDAAPLFSLGLLPLSAFDACLEYGDDHLRQTVSYVQEERPLYCAALRSYPSLIREAKTTEANFVLAHLSRPWTSAGFCGRLAEMEVLVGDCTSYGLQGWVRISIGPPGARRTLEQVLAAVAATDPV